MAELIHFPPTVEEFMEEYKVKSEDGAPCVEIDRMNLWFFHSKDRLEEQYERIKYALRCLGGIEHNKEEGEK